MPREPMIYRHLCMLLGQSWTLAPNSGELLTKGVSTEYAVGRVDRMYK